MSPISISTASEGRAEDVEALKEVSELNVLSAPLLLTHADPTHVERSDQDP
jgi:hypothetical protein